MRYVTPLVLNRWFRFLVLAVFLALAAASGYGSSRLSTNGNLSEAYPFDSFVISYTRILTEHFYATR